MPNDVPQLIFSILVKMPLKLINTQKFLVLQSLINENIHLGPVDLEQKTQIQVVSTKFEDQWLQQKWGH